MLICRNCNNTGINPFSKERDYCICPAGQELKAKEEVSKSLEMDLKKRFDFDLFK